MLDNFSICEGPEKFLHSLQIDYSKKKTTTMAGWCSTIKNITIGVSGLWFNSQAKQSDHSVPDSPTLQ